MTTDEVLQIIIAKLGENYISADHDVLEQILDSMIIQAETTSNRDMTDESNIKLLSPELISSTIIAYQQRGTEYAKNKSELGESSTFVDVDEYLRSNIIKNGKRVIY